MPKPQLIMALAKVLIAAAWTDGTITNEEINSLKDLLFHLPGMTARDWSELEIYIDSPVEAGERARLEAELRALLDSKADREFAINALEAMIQADGEVSPEERVVFQEVRAALEQGKTSRFATFSQLMRGPVRRRSVAVSQAPNRELYLEDFVNNRIFYELSHGSPKDRQALNLPETTLRKLSLAGGLMARVANVDRRVTAEELDYMVEAIQNKLNLERAESQFVAQVAVSQVSKDMDNYRLSREFFQATSEAERLWFLDTLFAVAAADGMLSHDEMEDIRLIANELKLTHQQFIDAKLKIPREHRSY